MVLFPVAQIVCFIPATINRLYNLILKEDVFALTVIQAILDYSLGFIITAIFVFSPTIKYSLLLFIKKKFGKNTSNIENTMLSDDFQGRLSDYSNSY
jgi:hypothetical protein